MRRVCSMCLIVGRRGTTTGVTTFSLILVGWLWVAVSTVFHYDV
jgi:hypothetical protein